MALLFLQLLDTLGWKHVPVCTVLTIPCSPVPIISMYTSTIIFLQLFMLWVGWEGIVKTILSFQLQNSWLILYIKYIDPDYRLRNLQFTTISLNFGTTETEVLIVWIGKAQNEMVFIIGLHNQDLENSS